MGGRQNKRLKLFSWSRHKRRLGGQLILNQYIDDENKLLDHKVTPNYFQTLSSKKLPLLEHLKNLEQEFEGQSLLTLYHAVLIVLIRREYKSEIVFQEFEKLWQTYPNELAQQLNIRWLVSAADTFIDYHSDPTVRALLLNIITLINTVKIYETEHMSQPGEFANTLTDKQKLFDGLETFVLNRDDSLLNMRRRMKSLTDTTPHGVILDTVFLRLHEHENAFSRLKKIHHQQRTQWWLK